MYRSKLSRSVSWLKGKTATITLLLSVVACNQGETSGDEEPVAASGVATATLSLFAASALPAVVAQPDGSPVELGMKFRSDIAGSVTGIKFYKSAQNTGSHTGHLWSGSGTLLASAAFTGESASGWQTASFTSPVAIAANTLYVVSYHTNSGYYSVNANYFATAGVDNGVLHAPSNAAASGNGVYRYGAGGAFPNQTWSSSNYWVDVLFAATTGCRDADGDTYADVACGGTDCNDGSAAIHPGAAETCGDTIDQDCAGGDQACPACGQGAISNRCACGGSVHTDGNCCSDVWRSNSCAGGASPWVTPQGATCTNGPTTSCEWAACKYEPLRTQGTIHYYCDCQAGAAPGCIAGVDSSSGTDPSAPRRTIGSARELFDSLAAGDTLAFCRGGSFGNAGGQWTNENGSASNPVIMRDYGSAPWHRGTEGRPRMTGQFNLWYGGGYRIMSLRLSGSDTFGFWALFSNTDVTYCNVEIDGYGISICPNGSQASSGGARRHKVIGSRFLNSAEMALLMDGDGNEVRNSYFWNNGTNNEGGGRNHTLYFGGDHLSHDEVIANNEIHSFGGTNGPVLVVHGLHDGTIVENNVIDYAGGTANPGGWGISTRPGYTTYEIVTNAVVRGNRITNPGNRGINAENCQHCLVENNVVIAALQGTTAIGAPANVTPDMGGGDARCTGNTVRNNTVYMTVGGAGISVGAEGSGYVVENNVVYSTGGASCFDWPSGASYAVRDYNLCGGRTESMLGVHSRNLNPQFVTAPADLRPAAGSPLIGAADPGLTPATDITGKPRPSPGAIGAYEP
jgi:hypothetical protein